MVRQQLGLPLTVPRNRNRITNKSRLKVYKGDLDAESYIPDDDDEKTRLQQSVAGVDQEDANEHHLQAVLSEAQKEKPTAYIPTPDSTGIVPDAQYQAFYPPDKYKDPTGYIASSQTIEEACVAGIADGFTYFMDERDKDWLDRNNEGARGEGTSALAALAAGPRPAARSAKSKGKDPESPQPMAISEDDFELVMGLFEKATHEKTEFLAHSMEHAMGEFPFPPFSDYMDVFSVPLQPLTFANFIVPPGIPPPSQLTQIALTIYPHWKQRRIERAGHRIMATVKIGVADETETINEYYHCFRRRELKAVRKTRTAHVASSEKLARLQTELRIPLQLAQSVANREALKREQHKAAEHVFKARLAMVELKRKNPSLGEKGDEELFIDKERPVKKRERDISKARLSTNKSETGTPAPVEKAMLPSERLAIIRSAQDRYLGKLKERDYNYWDDYVDHAYQTPYVPPSSRLFKYIQPSRPTSNEGQPLSTAPLSRPPLPRPVRSRIGRGGRMIIDRRYPVTLPVIERRAQPKEDDPLDDDEVRKMAERWRYDADDGPPFGVLGSDEQDRILVDDFDNKFHRYNMSFLQENDLTYLITDPYLRSVNSEGHQEKVYPYHLGLPPNLLPPRRPVPNGAMLGNRAIRPGPVPPGMQGKPINTPMISLTMQRNVAMLAQQQGKPQNVPQIRVPSSGAAVPMVPPAQPMQINGNGVTTPASVTAASQDVQMKDMTVPNGSPPNGAPAQLNGQISPPRLAPAGVIPNGLHAARVPINGSVVGATDGAPMSSGMPTTPSVLSVQQVQNLKDVFASAGNVNGESVHIPANTAHLPVQPTNTLTVANTAFANSGNITLKLPVTRPGQRRLGSGPSPQMHNKAINGNAADATRMSGSLSPNMPIRSPSRPGSAVPMPMRGIGATPNGVANGNVVVGVTGAPPYANGHVSPAGHHHLSQSPPRIPSTPTMSMTSPSQQPIKG